MINANKDRNELHQERLALVAANADKIKVLESGKMYGEKTTLTLTQRNNIRKIGNKNHKSDALRDYPGKAVK